jgi:hypothetical protein
MGDAGLLRSDGHAPASGPWGGERRSERRPHVSVINEALASHHFGSEAPIGKRIYCGPIPAGGIDDWHEIVGVVGDVRHRELEGEPDPRVYDLFGHHWDRTVSFTARTTDSPLQLASLVRTIVAERDPQLAVFSVRTMADLVAAAVSMRRLLSWLGDASERVRRGIGRRCNGGSFTGFGSVRGSSRGFGSRRGS